MFSRHLQRTKKNTPPVIRNIAFYMPAECLAGNDAAVFTVLNTTPANINKRH